MSFARAACAELQLCASVGLDFRSVGQFCDFCTSGNRRFCEGKRLSSENGRLGSADFAKEKVFWGQGPTARDSLECATAVLTETR